MGCKRVGGFIFYFSNSNIKQLGGSTSLSITQPIYPQHHPHMTCLLNWLGGLTGLRLEPFSPNPNRLIFVSGISTPRLSIYKFKLYQKDSLNLWNTIGVIICVLSCRIVARSFFVIVASKPSIRRSCYVS